MDSGQEYKTMNNTRLNKDYIKTANIVFAILTLLLIPTVVVLYNIDFKYIGVFEILFSACLFTWIVLMVLNGSCFCCNNQDMDEVRRTTTDAWEA
jgi:hypothetical protein